jgi:outer membrane biosynthesis protein TonB
MVIDANGKVEKAEALDPPSMLSDAALEAARDYVFKPATLAGKPIAARVTGRVHLN